MAAHELGCRHVERVNVRAFFAIDFDRNEGVIEELGNVLILEGFVCHDVTPVARRVTHAQENWSVEISRVFERVLTPRPPLNGIVGMVAQVRRAELVFGGS